MLRWDAAAVLAGAVACKALPWAPLKGGLLEILEAVMGWGAPGPEEQHVGDRQSIQKLRVWKQTALPALPPCHVPGLLPVAGERMC